MTPPHRYVGCDNVQALAGCFGSCRGGPTAHRPYGRHQLAASRAAEKDCIAEAPDPFVRQDIKHGAPYLLQ